MQWLSISKVLNLDLEEMAREFYYHVAKVMNLKDNIVRSARLLLLPVWGTTQFYSKKVNLQTSHWLEGSAEELRPQFSNIISDLVHYGRGLAISNSGITFKSYESLSEILDCKWMQVIRLMACFTSFIIKYHVAYASQIKSYFEGVEKVMIIVLISFKFCYNFDNFAIMSFM